MKQPKQTKRKFYGKWLYKISLELIGAPVFRQVEMENVLDFLKEESKSWRSSTVRNAWNNKTNIKLYLDTILSYDKDLYTVRIETNTLDIYTNERSLYDELSFNCSVIVKDRYEPGSAEDLLEAGNYKIVSKKYPHDKYKHKVYLQPHKLAHQTDEKVKYIQWVKGQGDKILISDTVTQWFMTTNWNWDRRYIYVDNESTLLMLKLRNPEVLGRVYDYVLSDK
jgi:hypothetical protein